MTAAPAPTVSPTVEMAEPADVPVPPTGSGDPAVRATVPQAVARVIRENTEVLFGLMGNGNAHLISELTSTGFPLVTVRHEAGAVAAADAYHRASGRVGVATVTYGAGFTNTLTALSEAALARIPLVLIVGDAPTTGPRYFDVDQAGMAAAAGVETVRLGADDPAAQARRAFADAASGRRPVVVAIPYDLVEVPVQQPAAALDLPAVPAATAEPEAPSAEELSALLAALRGAERPLLVAGRGVVDSPGAPAALRRLADSLGAFVATSVMARNVAGAEGDLGIAGGFARTERVEIMRQADVVLVVGAGMNPFQMRYGTLFSAEATVLQVDHRAEARHERTEHFLVSDAGAALSALAAAFQPAPAGNGRPDGGWRAHQPIPAAPTLDPVRADGTAEEGLAADGRLDPRAMALALDGILPPERTFVQDGGHFIGWVPLMCSVPDPRSHLFVGTAFQSIGLGFPSAVGAAAARPDRTTVLVTGDGGGLMALADLESFVRQARSGVVVVFNDAAYGAELHQYAVRGLDDEAMLIEEVDFAALGRAMGAQGTKARSLADLDALTDWVARGAEGVFVLDLPISRHVVAEYMAESMAGAQPAPRPLSVD
ncbi:acetolactate synthase I/II/III large subunit [Citricoccus zhacaiensis]|uniref:Acetolactate synthase I/II/III large subunit n=1 Tax=Citricoccus zhacaiensis TaxID=489142 RepID=A0ABQ2LRT5_9MICC|nr:thiamine pyrophosphate-binding protein [Citricoccus zhacaiensis]GGO42403.1 acetolactate synthase I/II/III large subunit [Citricoccus zhacaiensis]